jgi:cytoskeletal protein CcmA (bactofilin family)
MFRRKREDGEEMKSEPMAEETSSSDSAAARPMPRPMSPTPPSPAVSAAFAKPGAPVLGRAPSTWSAPRPAGTSDAPTESKRLIVGRDIVLSGQITSCEKLIVEGRVEASLTDTRAIEIAESGHFKGTAEIESAEIGGRFEGTLSVRERLFIRSTGKLSGKVTYGQIEIEPGGEISGEIHVGPRRPSSASEPEPAFSAAAKSD